MASNLLMMWLKRIIWLVLSASVSSLSVGAPLPIMHIEPSDIEADDINPSSSIYDSTYLIASQRVSLFEGSNYECCASLRDHDAILPVNVFVEQLVYLNVWCQIRIYQTKQDDLISVVANYLLFSQRLVAEKIIWSQQFTSVGNAACPLYDGRPGLTSFSCPQVVALPSINYRIYTFFNTFQFLSSSSASALPYFKIQVQIINLTTIQLRVQTEYLKISYGYYVYCLFIRADLFDLTHPKSLVFVQATYSYSKTAANSNDFLIPFPYYISEQNMFLGLASYRGFVSYYNFGTNNPPDNNIKGSSRIVGSSIQVFALGFYSYAETCPYYLTMACQKCPQYCKTCHVAPTFHCFQCQPNFILSSDKMSCSCPYTIVGGSCDNFPPGCTSPKIDPISGNIICGSCNLIKKLTLVSGNCKCIAGYDFDTNNQCKDVCGDGIVIDSPCDDGNKIPGDGCNEKCQIELGYQLDYSLNPPQIKSQIMLRYGIKNIMRDETQNSAKLILTPQNNQKLPFKVNLDQFDPISSKIKFKIILSQIPYKQQIIKDYWIVDISQSNEITIGFQFQFSIQGCQGRLQLNYDHTKYKNETQKLIFTLKGDNYALRVTEYGATYKSMSGAMLAATILSSICLCMGFPTSKFIGLESVLTAQLIYFSQLLIFDVSSWPSGFIFIKNLKYSSGFNAIFSFTEYQLYSTEAKKMQMLGIKKLLIQNFNVSFLLFLIVFVFTIASSIFRKHKVTCTIEQVREMRQQKLDHLIDNFTKTTAGQLNQLEKINNISFRIAHQISLWLILPLISSVSAQFLIANNQFTFLDDSYAESFLTTGRGVILLVTLFMIFCILLNNFQNIWLSLASENELNQRSEEITYKNLLFLYLYFAGIMIFFFNSVQIWFVYASALVLILHLCYFFGLIIIDPYRQSLKIHTVSLYINNGIVLVFLSFINVLNYVKDLAEVAVLGLAFFLIAGTTISLFLAFARLYYEIRYGKQLQDKIFQEKEQIRLEKQKGKLLSLKNHEQKLKRETELKKTEQQKVRDKNTYLIENQKKQENKVEYFGWIQNRDWDQKIKDKQYLKNFDDKPLYYLKLHDPQKYEKKMQQLDSKMKQSIERRQRRTTDPQYQNIVNELRRQMQQIKEKQKTKVKSKNKEKNSRNI